MDGIIKDVVNGYSPKLLLREIKRYFSGRKIVNKHQMS